MRAFTIEVSDRTGRLLDAVARNEGVTADLLVAEQLGYYISTKTSDITQILTPEQRVALADQVRTVQDAYLDSILTASPQ